MKRVFSLQIIFLILLSTATVWAKEGWFELKTANFQLAGNVSENELREAAAKLESFDETFRKSFPKFRFNKPFPTKVVVSTDLKPRQTFVAAEDANYISLSPTGDYADIFHGYVQFLIANNLGAHKIPAWLNYGIAEYFANRLNTQELLLSQQNNLSALPILLETDYFTLQSQNEERKALFRAQSLAFLSFLLKEEKFENIEKLIEFFRQGKDTREALILTFQFDYKKSEDLFRQFLNQPKLVENTGISSANQEFPVTPISEAKGLAVLGEFFYYANRPKEAAQMLEKSLKLKPDLSPALSTLALLKAKEFYYDEAEELAEKAIKNEPENFQNYYRHAVVLSRQGMTEHGFVSGYHPALAEKMRQSLKKAVELNPDFTPSYALFAFVNFVRNEQLDDSLKLLEKALDAAPNNQRYLLRRAELNLRKENFIEARRDVLAVFRSAPTESLKLYAQNTLQRIDSTEFQLNRIRNERAKYVNDDIVSDQPLSEEEIKRLREKAVAEQIRAVLRRPKTQEKRIIGSLTRIECGKEKVDFFFKTQNGMLKLQSKSFDSVSLISFIEGMTDFRLNCGNVGRENYASIIYGNELKADNLISIEFVPKGFKLQN